MSAGVYHGTKTLPAAGSQPAQLATPATCGAVLVLNPTGNSTIYVGGSDGTATLAPTTGIPVLAGQSINLDVDDVGAIYIVGTEADVVRFIATTRARRA